ncbi:MAG: hypothetical protein H6Q74_992 [Firmicutes bacterium]|nr:hypothetical protein [Bacillota bacterium]
MRVGLMVILLMTFLIKPVGAVLPVTAETIGLAQDYGRQNAGLALADFLRAWTVYEENAERLNDTTDQACFYTPFLLLAADARDKTLEGAAVGVSDGKNVLEPYNCYVVFSANLFGTEQSLADGAEAMLRQGSKTVNAVVVYKVSQPEQVVDGVLCSKLYIYFMKNVVDLKKPAELTIVNDRHERKFYFNLAGFK